MFTRSLSTNGIKKKQEQQQQQQQQLQPRSKAAAEEAQQEMWTSVALQQHMLRSLDAEGRLSADMPLRPRPLRQGELSLAHRMGIAPAPPQRPNNDHWTELEKKSADRGDLAHHCAICFSKFSAQDAAAPPPPPTGGNTNSKKGSNGVVSSSSSNYPIILSCCGASFHASCLAQLEESARRSRVQRKCCLCRGIYWKRPHSMAKSVLQAHAVVKIQCCWRGHVARRRFLKMGLGSNPAFRSDYYYNRLRVLSDAQVAVRAAQDNEAEEALEACDFAMELMRACRMSDRDWASVLEAARSREAAGDDSNVCSSGSGNTSSSSSSSSTCPICLESVSLGAQQPIGAVIESWPQELIAAGRAPAAAAAAAAAAPPLAAARRAVITSCAHTFHACCLMRLEQFAPSGRPRCAQCRAAYAKRFVEKVEEPPVEAVAPRRQEGRPPPSQQRQQPQKPVSSSNVLIKKAPVLAGRRAVGGGGVTRR